MERRISILIFLIGLTFLAINLNDDANVVNAEAGPSETECRPFIEKALHELNKSDDKPNDDDNNSAENTDAPPDDSGPTPNNNDYDDDDDTDNGSDGDNSNESQEKQPNDQDDSSENVVNVDVDDDDNDNSKENSNQTDDDDDNNSKDNDSAEDNKNDDDKPDDNKNDDDDDDDDDTNDSKNNSSEEQKTDDDNDENKSDETDKTVNAPDTDDSKQDDSNEDNKPDDGTDHDDDDDDNKSDSNEDDDKKDDDSKEDNDDKDDNNDTKENMGNDDDDSKETDNKDDDSKEDNDSKQDDDSKEVNDSKQDDDSKEGKDSKEDTDSKDENDSKEDTDSKDSKEDDNSAEDSKADDNDSTEDAAAAKPDDGDSKENDDDDSKEDGKPDDDDDSKENADGKTDDGDDSKENDDSKEADKEDDKDDDDDDSKEKKVTAKKTGEEKKKTVKETESKKPSKTSSKAPSKKPSKAAAAAADDDDDSDESTEIENISTEHIPEEDLLLEYEIPTKLRDRKHIAELLHLDDQSEEKEETINKVADVILRDLKRIYENAIKPLETLYKYRDLSNRHFGDPEIFSKPLILFMGPWSGGKSTILNYLTDNEYTENSLRTGAEPSPAYFNILMHGKEPEVLDGTQLAADWTFSGLQKFGQGLEERIRGLKLPSKLLEKVNIVEIPGILEVRKQVSRLFPFNDACQWFIDRADIIFLVYDPSKLDVGPETEAILDQLKGREYQTRILLNKGDQVKPEELMRVQSALIWNISPLMSSAQPPVMYTTSLWSHPYEVGAPVRLLQAQERAFLRDLRNAIDKRIDNKIASARRFAVRVRNHAKMVDCYLTTYYNHKTLFGNKKIISDQIIENPQNYHIYEGLSTLTNISRYDLPDPHVYRGFFRLNALYEFKKLSETCTYFRGCPINKLDVAIAYDLPELVGKYRKLAEAALLKLETDHSSLDNQQQQNTKDKS